MPRKPLFRAPMTGAERQRRYMERRDARLREEMKTRMIETAVNWRDETAMTSAAGGVLAEHAQAAAELVEGIARHDPDMPARDLLRVLRRMAEQRPDDIAAITAPPARTHEGGRA